MPMDLLEQMYCSQQINIPPNLPFILKQYAKAAIRTQPHDLLYWSAAYFRAKADNTPPPVKERLEYPPIDSPSRLSPGFLKVLHKQLGGSGEVAAEILYSKWLGVCLVKESLDAMLKIGGMGPTIQWLQFVAIAAGHLCPSLTKTMVTVCEVLTEEPNGGSAMIPVDVFVTLYQFLARLDCGPKDPNQGLAAVESNTTVTSLPESQHSDQSDSHLRGSKFSKDIIEVDEKDSAAGLMVWQDLKPSDKDDTLRSPRYTDELGASSELGIEVLDDAKGPVQEILTLYSVQDTVESEMSLPSHPPNISSNQFPDIDENVLSHSSLKENEDWIKIEPRKMEEEVPEQDEVALDLEEKPDKEIEQVSIEETEETKTSDPDETMSGNLAEEKEPSEEEKSDKMSVDRKTEELMVKSVDGEKEIITQHQSKTVSFDDMTHSKSSDGTSNLKSTSQITENKSAEVDIKPILSNKSVEITDVISSDKDFSVTDSSTKVKAAEPSTDSVFGLEESVTVERFVKDDLNGSIVTYSTGEIRKGVFGHESHEQIERDSSERVVKAAETVHRLGSVEDDSSVLLPAVKSSSDKFSLQDTQSFVVLEEFWQEIPGIGPVIPEPQILAVVEYMQYWATKQEGMVMPRNINHILCPPLDPLPTNEEEDAESHY